MESGKRLIVSVLLMSLVISQIQVEAKSCCPSTTARNIYNTCRFTGGSREMCASLSGCKHVSGKCPNGWDHLALDNNGDVVNNYCKLGCESTVCAGMISLRNSDSSEVVNGAVEKCVEVCAAVCTKGSSVAAALEM